MPLFTVTVSKDYWKRYNNEDDDEDTITVEGEMEVEATSQEEAENKVEEEMKPHDDGDGGVKTLQTTDPRITWEQDVQDLHNAGYEYADFTFRVERD